MNHYLRYGDDTIVDVSATKDDLRSMICIRTFSVFLLSNLDKKNEIIQDFHRIQELRGEFFEGRSLKDKFIMSAVSRGISPDELCRAVLQEIGSKYLHYGTD